MPRFRFTLAVLTTFLTVAAATLPAQDATPVPSPAPTQDNATLIDAAKKFLATLDDAQRGKIVFDFKDDAQRRRWSNFPTSFVKRGGLRLGDLTPQQREAALAVVAAALSPRGYEKVLQTMEGDEVLKKTDSGFPGGPGGGPGGPGGGPGGPGGPDGFGGPSGPGGPDSHGGTLGPVDSDAKPNPDRPNQRGGPGGRRGPGGPGGPAAFGRDNYYIAFLGQPSATDPWMLQFGGHHLGLNLTFVGPQATLAPSHTGAQPAIYDFESKTVRVFGRENDQAFALLTSLDDAQRKQAILGYRMRDLVLGPGRDGQTMQPEGIKGSALNDKQRDMLLDLAAQWTGLMPPAAAQAKLDDIRKNLAETWFAWSGPTEKSGAAYFRIQGPTVIIELAPQSIGGDPSNHFHTIYREPANDYGAAWLKTP